MSSFELTSLDSFIKGKSIGKGSFGEVYEVEEKHTGKIFACKILLKKIFPETPAFQNFKQEVINMSKLDYPSILKFIGFSPINFKKSHKPMILTEYMTQGSLSNYTYSDSQPNILDDTKKLIIIYGIASGMYYLHFKKIGHFDLKPENILLDDNLYPRISDFGLSKFLPNGQTIQSSHLFGTPGYMAPESLLECQYSLKSDVYSFSFIVYALFSYKNPFSGMIEPEYYSKMKIGWRPEIGNDIPIPYQKLIQKCWNQEPSARPTFYEIRNILKTEEFLNIGIDKEEYLNYIDYIKESENNLNKIGKSISIDYYMQHSQFLVRASLARINLNKVAEISEYYNDGCHHLHLGNIEKAVEFFQKGIDEGDSKCYVEYAELLIDGTKVPQDIEQAIEYLEIACQKEDVKGILAYADLLYEGGVIPMNKEKALSLYEKAADLDDVEAIYIYANILHDQFERRFDAALYYKKAADYGHEPSIIKFFQILKNEHNFKMSKKDELFYIKKAADLQDIDAINLYADSIIEDNIEEAIKYYELGVSLGSAYAMNKYAYNMFYGKGIEKNEDLALSLFQKAIKQNETEAMYNYGIILYQNFNNKIEAAQYFQKAADLGHIKSASIFGEMLMNGDGIEKNPELARDYFKKAADSGDSDSLYYYGLLLFDDLSDENKKRSMSYFEQAANKGNVQAMLKIASFYENGQFVDKDIEKALHYYKMAADLNNMDAVIKTADILMSQKTNLREASKYLKKAAEYGDNISMSKYAHNLFYGIGVIKNLPEAANFYKMAADHGNANAMNNYANMCLNGLGIPVNKEEAFTYFEKSALENNSYGCYNFAIMLSQGEIMVTDKCEIINYLKIAADQGHIYAIYRLGLIMANKGDVYGAFPYFRKAADLGHVESMYQAGRLLYTGQGVKKNCKEGIRLLNMAREKGLKKASSFLFCIESYKTSCSIC